MKKTKINNNLIFTIFLFTFLGYYASLLLFSNFVSFEFSRQLTVPLRLVIVFSLLMLLITNKFRINNSKSTILFFLFAIVYLIRIFIDFIQSEPYYLSYQNVFFYFISFSVLPFIIIKSIKISKKNIDSIFKSLLIGGISFSILSVIFYTRFIGQVYRLSSTTAGEEVLSPLALSYCSSLLICVFIFYLLHNKTSFIKKIILLSTILLSTIPFFLGASRGSILAIIISFVIYFFTEIGKKSIFRTILITAIVMISIISLDAYLESGLIGRFTNISKDIESGSSSALRIILWETALNQFADFPIIGDKLRVNNFDGYPHNIIIEVLQTTGIIGFIPFILLIISAWRKLFFIAKYYKEHFWLLVIFIQSFVHHLFSGAIYTGAWLWTSMALVFILYDYLKLNNDVCSTPQKLDHLLS